MKYLKQKTNTIHRALHNNIAVAIFGLLSDLAEKGVIIPDNNKPLADKWVMLEYDGEQIITNEFDTIGACKIYLECKYQ